LAQHKELRLFYRLPLEVARSFHPGPPDIFYFLPTMQTCSLLWLVPCALVGALELPSAHVHAHSALAQAPSRWWAQVDDRVYYAPPASFLGLSQNVSDYYYVMGSKSALTGTMKDHVVGSQGRWHIMHLPKGPSMLEISSQSRNGDRRSSLSALSRLKSGMVLSAGFPAYELSGDYVHPLDAAGQAVEKAAVAHITADSTMNFLKTLTESFPTRSYNNATASDKVEHFLQKQLQGMGMHTCFHQFTASSNALTNVIAHIPGSGPGSVTVGAHYDSRPFEGNAPGAEDNGSGVASMLAMAQAFAKSKVTPKKSVFFVAFAGEEPGLLGSNSFANALKADSLPADCTANGASLVQQIGRKRMKRTADESKHQAIIMDEIGWASPKMSQHTVNLESHDGTGETNVMDHLRHSTKMHNADSIDVTHNGHPFGSDHMSFLDIGFPAVLTINADDEAYPNYHKSTDTIDNVNADLMAKITRMNLGALYRMVMA